MFLFSRVQRYWKGSSIVAFGFLVALFVGKQRTSLTVPPLQKPHENVLNNLLSDHAQLEKQQSRALTTQYEIRVPTDMWRSPTSDPDWNPRPLPFCCVNRKGKEIKSKYGESGIRYYGPGIEYGPNDLKEAIRAIGGDIVIIGDSVNRYWYHQLTCYLGGEISPADGDLQLEIKESFLNFRPEWRMHYNWNHPAAVRNFPAKVPGGPKTRILYVTTWEERRRVNMERIKGLIKYFDKRYPKDFLRGRPIFVINIGLHYNLYPEGAEKDLEVNLRILMMRCRSLGAKCIFRETTPQFFDTEKGDGLFPRNRHHLTCFPNSKTSFGELSQWRNDVLRKVFKEVSDMGEEKKGGFLKFMPLFSKLEGWNINHMKAESDCTHPSCDSSNWEPFHVSLTEVLLGILKTQAKS